MVKKTTRETIARKTLKRRQFLGTLAQAAGLVCLPHLACKQSQAASKTTAKKAAKGICRITEDNIEGPFYCQNAPSRVALAGPKEPGQRLHVSGRILEPDCKTPIPGAVIELWQANTKGDYDNTCLQGKGPHKHKLRGQLKAGAKGQYSYDTIVPGRYLNGPTYRPAHIHYKVSAPGYESLTTQLYFEGDPYIKGDPFVKTSLVIKLQKQKSKLVGHFDLVLARKPTKK